MSCVFDVVVVDCDVYVLGDFELMVVALGCVGWALRKISALVSISFLSSILIFFS